MEIRLTPSGADSGYSEACATNPNINQTRPDRRIWLADGSSPVPNCRPAELLLTIWAAHQFGPSVPLDIDLTSAGVSFQTHTLEDLDKLDTWFEFFSLRLMQAKPEAFIPFAPAGLLIPNEIARQDRMRKMEQIAERLSPEMGKISLDHVVIEDGAKYFDLPFSRGMSLLPQRTSIGKFVCPICSYQQKQVVSHAVRVIRGQLSVTHVDSTGHVNCPAARAFLQKIGEGDSKISDLIRTVGFIPSGKLFYLCTGNGEATSRGLCMRDYSNPRGTVAATVRQWNPHIWISTRFYVLDQDGTDTAFDPFMESVERCRTSLALMMRDHSVLSSGQVISLVRAVDA